MSGIVTALLLSAASVDSPVFLARMEQAVVRGARPALEEARTALLAARAERDTPLRSYTLAYASWRLVSLLPRDGRTEAMALLREAETALRSVVAAEPDNAEARALLASVMGRMIGFQPSLGATLGPRASEEIRAAQRLDGGRSPRLPLLRGIRAFVVYPNFGGTLEGAEAELREAERLFAAEPPGKTWPNWGRLDTLAWLGQVLERKGDKAGARAAYTRALEMNPDYGFVSRALLPALDARKP
jgi:tetratricopeptide (TPR) repeat protein